MLGPETLYSAQQDAAQNLTAGMHVQQLISQQPSFYSTALAEISDELKRVFAHLTLPTQRLLAGVGMSSQCPPDRSAEKCGTQSHHDAHEYVERSCQHLPILAEAMGLEHPR